MKVMFIISMIRAKILMRKRLLLVLCLVLPIIFYFIISEIFVQSDVYNKIPVVLIDEDNTETSRQITDKLKNNDSLRCYDENMDKALKGLEDGKVEGVYVFKKGLELGVKNGSIGNLVDVYYLPQNTAAVGLTDMVAGEIIPVVCFSKAGTLGEELYKQYKNNSANIIKENIINYAESLEGDKTYKLPILFNTSRTKDISEIQNKFNRSDLGRRSVLGMLVLFNTLFILSSYSNIMSEKTNKVYTRIKATGVSRISILCADILGIMIVCFFIGVLQITMLYPIFKFKGVGTVLSIMIIYLFYSYCIASMLILFTKIFKNFVSLQSFIPQFAFFIALLGGCLLGIELIPKNIRPLSMIMPTYWANDALTKIILQNGNVTTIFLNLIVIMAMGIAFSLVSIRKDSAFY